MPTCRPPLPPRLLLVPRRCTRPPQRPFSAQSNTLTLLLKTKSFLPRALPQRSLPLWDSLLSAAHDDLSLTSERPARIVVYGLDEWSGAHDLVTALLEEPFGSEEQNIAVRQRWKDHPNTNSLTISHTTSDSNPKPSALHISSSYLLQFPLPPQLTELANPNDTTTLFGADIPIIVCNPVTTPLSAILRASLPLHNANAVLVLALPSSLPPSNVFDVLPPTLNSSSNIPPGNLKIIITDPARAIQANRTLMANSGSSKAVQRYQDEFTGSRVSALTDALKATLTPGLGQSRLQAQTVRSQIQGALLACRASLKQAKEEVNNMCTDISSLMDQIEETQARVQREIFFTPEQANPTTARDEIGEALKCAEIELRAVMNQLTWWRMIWRADEISGIMSTAVEKAWCRGLEKQLVMHAGRLSAIQDQFTKSTFSLLSAHPNPPFDSPILGNSLHQLTSSPFYPLTTSALTAPIYTRQAQLTGHLIPQLHVAGQRAVLGLGGGLAASTGVGLAGWVGWLAGTGEGIFSFVGMDAGTAVGVGVLGALASVRWAVGKWERSKDRWWKDWFRVSDGLRRDLKETLDRTVQKNVTVVANNGCHELTKLVARRKEQIQDIEEELGTLYEDLIAIQHPSDTPRTS